MLTSLRVSPKHWLSDIVENILNNTVSTRARPLTTTPISPLEASRTHPLAQIHLEPFLEEFAVIASLWEPLLPFGLSSTQLIPQSDILTCSIRFPVLKALRGAEVFTPVALMFTMRGKGGRRPDVLSKMGQNSQVWVMSVCEVDHETNVSPIRHATLL